MPLKYWQYLLIIKFLLLGTCQCVFIMSKLKCYATGPLYYQFEACELHNNTQGLPLLTINLRYMNRPVANCLFQYVVKGKWNRANRFVFNKTYDICDYMKNRKNNKILAMHFNLILPFTNMNHSCPYDHDVFVKNFNPNIIRDYFHKMFPWPSGLYKCEFTYILDKKSRMYIKLDFQI